MGDSDSSTSRDDMSAEV